jgi:hypothetical protein
LIFGIVFSDKAGSTLKIEIFFLTQIDHMKKTALTLVALAFGMGVSFAQTNPQTEEPATETEQSVEKENLSNEQPAAPGLKTITIGELPLQVQDALNNEEFGEYTVVAVAEVPKQEGATTQYYQAALAPEEGAKPTLIVLFNDKGKAVARKEMNATEGGE